MVSYPNHNVMGKPPRGSLPVLSIHSFHALLESAEEE